MGLGFAGVFGKRERRSLVCVGVAEEASLFRSLCVMLCLWVGQFFGVV
jgi:hypothetical protein